MKPSLVCAGEGFFIVNVWNVFVYSAVKRGLTPTEWKPAST